MSTSSSPNNGGHTAGTANPGRRAGLPGFAPAPTAAAPSALRSWWAALSARDRSLVKIGGTVLALYLLWALALQPAISAIRSAPAELDALDGQLQAMQRLALESQELRGAPPVNPAQAAAALRAATERLGEAGRITVVGDRAVLTLNAVATTPLRDWMGEARSGARARPVEANLTRGAQGYSGTLVLSLGGGS